MSERAMLGSPGRFARWNTFGAPARLNMHASRRYSMDVGIENSSSRLGLVAAQSDTGWKRSGICCFIARFT
jgi:hypothetical protein